MNGIKYVVPLVGEQLTKGNSGFGDKIEVSFQFSRDLRTLTYHGPSDEGYHIYVRKGLAGEDGPMLFEFLLFFGQPTNLDVYRVTNLSSDAKVAEIFELIQQRRVYVEMHHPDGRAGLRGQIIPILHLTAAT